jgi:hypothetical protein
MAMVFAGYMPSACGMYICRWSWSNIYTRTDASIYDVVEFDNNFGLNTRNNSDYNPRNEDVAVYAVIETQTGIPGQMNAKSPIRN